MTAIAYPNLDATATQKFLREHPDAIIIDVRTPEEYREGHLKNAVNSDIFDPSFVSRIKELDTTKKYLVYCKSGGRSSSALGLFRQLGFPHVTHMACGINGWKNIRGEMHTS